MSYFLCPFPLDIYPPTRCYNFFLPVCLFFSISSNVHDVSTWFFSLDFLPLRMRLLGREGSKSWKDREDNRSSWERLGQRVGGGRPPPIPHTKSQRICQPGENMFGTAALSPSSSTMLAGMESSWNLLYESLDWTIFQWLSWPRSGHDFFLLFFFFCRRKKGEICEKFWIPFFPIMIER